MLAISLIDFSARANTTRPGARLAAAVALAILIAGAVATTIGLVLPWLLQRSGSDPAFGSGPIATIVQDVLSLVIYFAVASALLPV